MIRIDNDLKYNLKTNVTDYISCSPTFIDVNFIIFYYVQVTLNNHQ